MLPIEQVKDAVIKGTISKSLAIGKAYRLAKENNQDIAEEIASHGGGYVAFRGAVARFNFRTQDGFTLGDVFIDGTGQYKNDKYHIEVKNENLVSRLNGIVDVTIPDLICCLDMDTNTPITNPNVTYGTNVAIVVLPAPKEFVTEKGLNAFGPAYAGIDAPYQAAVERHFINHR